MAKLIEPSEYQRTVSGRPDPGPSTGADSSTDGEPKEATNKAMTIAIFASVLIAIAMFIWGYVILQQNEYTDTATSYAGATAHVNGQPTAPASTTKKPKGDVSNVGNQAVSSDAIIDSRIGDTR
jgi:hypothetical protein